MQYGLICPVFMQLFMPYLNFEYTKPLTYTMQNVGGGIDQDPANEVANLGLNQLQFSPVKCEHECDMLTSIAIIFLKGVIYMIV